MLAEIFSQDPLETYFCKQHPPGAWVDKLPLCDFGYVKTFRKQKVSEPIATGKVKDENIDFESNRTSSLLGKIQTKQSLLSLKVSSSRQIPSYQTNTKSKWNDYINKLTLRYFNSLCQPFHIPFVYNIFDQHLFCCYEKLFQSVRKKVIKIKKWLALNLPLTSLLGRAPTSICHFFCLSICLSIHVVHHISGTVHHLIIIFGTIIKRHEKYNLYEKLFMDYSNFTYILLKMKL